ncbi:hypothetical protein AB6A40_008202 [Gnathostoma spinigerum]|uniref:VWFD domain-containing protein n=1 Tax=Gnathostoma spinigerum TaxID=75299 RepID=A0ABD6EWQ2_9BILA
MPIPHIRIENWPEYRVLEDSKKGYVVLTVRSIGVRIVWDGKSFAEITLSHRHRSKVCGLCGNFNGRPDDDMWPKYGTVVSSTVSAFARSWQYGAKCSNPRHRKKQGKHRLES